MSPMNNRLLVPQKLPLLLDYAPGAAAAYSLRSLSNSYVGPVVTVRRSTDSAEADFTATEVSDGTLAAWCGGGDGFVKQWWDQSGTASHMQQASASSQPKIVSAGVLVEKNNHPSILFDGANDYLSAGPFNNADKSDATGGASFVVYSLSAARESYTVFINTPDGTSHRDRFTGGTTYACTFRGSRFLAQPTSLPNLPSDLILYSHSVNAAANTHLMKKDAVQMLSQASDFSNWRAQVNVYYRIGLSVGPGDYAPAYISEVIMYGRALSSGEESRIEGDIAWRY
jgi:hypothetical protein